MKVTDIITESFLEEGPQDRHVFKAIFVIGSPGSGKNTVINQFMQSGFKVEDIDDVLHKYKKLAGAHVDYKQSYDIVAKRRSLWQQSWLPLIINTTGRRLDRTAELKQTLEEYGYDTMGVFVYVTHEVAWKRTQSRKVSSTNPADLGRHVDRDYFDDTYQALQKLYPQYKQLFAPNFVMYLNDETQVAKDIQELQIRKVQKAVKTFINTPVQNPIGQQKIQGTKKDA